MNTNFQIYRAHRTITTPNPPKQERLKSDYLPNQNSLEALITMPHPKTKHPTSVMSLLGSDKVSAEVKDYIKTTLLKPIPAVTPLYDDDEKFPDIIPSIQMSNSQLLDYLKSLFSKSKTSEK